SRRKNVIEQFQVFCIHFISQAICILLYLFYARCSGNYRGNRLLSSQPTKGYVNFVNATLLREIRERLKLSPIGLGHHMLTHILQPRTIWSTLTIIICLLKSSSYQYVSE